MSLRNTPDRYGTAARLFHWAVVALFVALYVIIELREGLPKGPGRDALMALHRSLGVTTLLVVLARLGWRALDPAPAPLPMPALQARAAHLAHLALYALMLLMPLSGYAATVARGRPVALFGAELPMLLPQSEFLGAIAKGVHEFGATAIYGVVAAHVAGALYHHLVLKDATLARMAPFPRASR